ATALAEQLRDPERLGWICLYQTVVHTELDGALEAVEWGRRAVALAEEAGEPILTLSAYSAVIAACHTVGDYRQAIEAANCAPRDSELNVMQGLAKGSVHVLVFYLPIAEAELGLFDDAVRHGETSTRRAEAAGNPFAIAVACVALGFAQL